MGIVLRQRIHPGDIGSFHTVEHHIHGADAQHGLIGIEAGEHSGSIMLLVLGAHQLALIMLGDILGSGGDKAGRTHSGVADGILQSGLHQFHHHLDDMARGAELAIGAGLGDLRKQVLIYIAHDVLVVQIQAVQRVNHTHQHAGGGDKEQRILHILGKGSILTCVQLVLDKRKYFFVHIAEHGLRLIMTEIMPPAILMLRIKSRIYNRHIKCGCIGFFAQFIIVQNFDEHQVCNLLDNRQGVGHTGRPENIPNAVDFIFQFASNHINYLPIYLKSAISIFYGVAICFNGNGGKIVIAFAVGNCVDLQFIFSSF